MALPLASSKAPAITATLSLLRVERDGRCGGGGLLSETARRHLVLRSIAGVAAAAPAAGSLAAAPVSVSTYPHWTPVQVIADEGADD